MSIASPLPRSVSPQAGDQPKVLLARQNDVETRDGIINSMYTVISGPAGQKRDWDRFRSLFLPGARFILDVAKKGEKPRARFLDVEDYIRRVDPIFERESFWEREKSRQTKMFGNVAHVFSNYESRRKKNGRAFQRGTNSIQLFYDDTRWWIATVMWNTERE